MKYYKDKTVLVTGAGGSLGSLMSRKLLDAGASVVAVDLHEGALGGIRDAKLRFFRCDLSQASAIAALARDIKKAKISIDILINNAGIVNGSFLRDTSPEAIEKALAINLHAPILLVRHFAGDLEKNRGHLVNISSAAGLIGVSRLSDYSAAKFGLFGFNEAMRFEWKRLKERVATTVVCPYYLKSEMFKGAKTRFPLLLPILTPEYIVMKILKGVAGKKKHIVFLFMVWSIRLLRLLPVSVFDAISSFFGINKSMDEFAGRNGKPVKTASAPKSAAKKAIKSAKTKAVKKTGSGPSAKKSAKK